MADIPTIAAALASLKAATDIAKLMKDSGLTLEKAEAKLKLAELLSALADAKSEFADIQQVVIEKEKTIRELEERLDVKAKLKWEQPYYWIMDGDSQDGPFCQRCYDKDGKLIRLQGHGGGYWDCKACQNNYTDKNYREDTGHAVTDYDPFDQ